MMIRKIVHPDTLYLPGNPAIPSRTPSMVPAPSSSSRRHSSSLTHDDAADATGIGTGTHATSHRQSGSLQGAWKRTSSCGALRT